MIGMYEREKRLGNGDRKRSGWGLHDRDGRQWNNGINGYRASGGSENIKERVKLTLGFMYNFTLNIINNGRLI